MASAQPSPAAFRLAQRLRELREREFVRLTQGDLGQALGDADDALSPATISMWENAASGRVPPRARLEAYARLFCTPRSFEGGVHMLGVAELTAAERDRLEGLQRELLGLRDSAVSREEGPSVSEAQSMWHFPDGARITLVCYRLEADRRPSERGPGRSGLRPLFRPRRPGHADRHLWRDQGIQPHIASLHHGCAGPDSARCLKSSCADRRIDLENRYSLVFSYFPATDRRKRSC